MPEFNYIDGLLHAEGVAVDAIENTYGSPVYIYSRAAIESAWRSYDTAFKGRPHLICYAVKANSNLAILNILARLGSGFDIVSVGELERVIKAGGDPSRIVFSGVGKREDEILAALGAGVKCLNVESASELERVNTVAHAAGLQAPVSIRVNPDVDPKTHPYISTGLKGNKFGVAIEEALSLYLHASTLKHIDIVGVDCHIGSQITQLAPYEDALERVMQLLDSLLERGIQVHHLDIGGGLGISYHGELPPSPADFVEAICRRVGSASLELIIEPGRSIVGNAGMLLSKVLYLKKNSGKNFAIIDAAMNDLMRPALYDAWQEIIPVIETSMAGAELYDIVGPVCESADFLGLNRRLTIAEGDLIAIMGAGAYGFCMSSNYNSRPRAAEIMVDDQAIHEIRRRECIEDLYRGESLLP